MLTEDMDVTWKLQLQHWVVRFEPHALAWILMPETIKGLWAQRLRWAMGGLQIIGRYKTMWRDWRTYSMWPLFCEHLLSILWACSVGTVLAVSFLQLVFSLVGKVAARLAPGWLQGLAPDAATATSVTALLPEFSGVIITTTCLLQMLLSTLLDRHYDPSILRYYLWVIWYPLGFWLVNMLTSLVAIPKILFRKPGTRARWVSPDRGMVGERQQAPRSHQD